jgi:hypothetical protein
MFHSVKNLKESNLDFIFNLSKKYIEAGDPSSLIAAYRLLKSVQEYEKDREPDKAVIGYLGVVREKLQEKDILSFVESKVSMPKL